MSPVGGLDTYNVGVQVTNVTTGTPLKPEPIAGCEVVQITFDLTSTTGAATVAETAVGGRTDWANDSNATGLPDAVTATIAGNALAARGGQLEFTYADQSGAHSELTISSVTLLFRVSQAGTIGANGDLRLLWRKSGAFVTLQTITGDVALADISHVITGSITSWADIDAIEAAVRFESALGETQTATCDAVSLVVVASVTDVI